MMEPCSSKLVIFQKYSNGHFNNLFRTTDWRIGQRFLKKILIKLHNYIVSQHNWALNHADIFLLSAQFIHISPDMKLLCTHFISQWVLCYTGTVGLLAPVAVWNLWSSISDEFLIEHFILSDFSPTSGLPVGMAMSVSVSQSDSQSDYNNYRMDCYEILYIESFFFENITDLHWLIYCHFNHL